MRSFEGKYKFNGGTLQYTHSTSNAPLDLKRCPCKQWTEGGRGNIQIFKYSNAATRKTKRDTHGEIERHNTVSTDRRTRKAEGGERG